jgi:acyl-CoA reductase-like NAD-dependent aldehyde dehydrogenase
MEIVVSYVRKGIQSGAKLITGSQRRVENPEGYYYAPTLFDHVTLESEQAREEIFGPVLPVIRVPDADRTIAVANNTRLGLAASLFIRNQRLIEMLQRRNHHCARAQNLQAGSALFGPETRIKSINLGRIRE